MRIDAHQHFWIFDPVRDSWIDDSMKIIKRDFLPNDLEPILTEHHTDGCVAVQANQTEEQNTFLLALAEKNQFIKGIVGWVDLQSHILPERLEYYSEKHLIKGFRHVLQGESQRDMMLRPAFLKGISLLEKYSFTYDILIFPDQINFSEQMVKSFPNQKFVIDHLAKPDIKNQNFEKWTKDIQSIAKHPNVYCKVSGMVTEADWNNWKLEDFKPCLDTVFEAFGVSRLMFGFDWPVCNLAGGYQNSHSILTNYTNKLSSQEQALFYGLNASKFYNL